MPRLHVLLAVAPLPELLGADQARIRLLARMNPVVVLQGIGAEELLRAGLQILIKIIIKSLSVSFTPPTHRALVSPLAAVDQPVLVEHGAGEEALAADQALVRPLVRVELANVVVEVRPDREPPVASLEGALERLHALVEPQVLPQVAGLRVRLAAHVTQILPRLRHGQRLHPLRVIILKVLAVLDAVIVQIAAHLAAHQQLLVQVRVAWEIVILLVPANEMRTGRTLDKCFDIRYTKKHRDGLR